MNHIEQFINFKDVPTLSPELSNKEKRDILMREIYDFYKRERDMRKKENWHRYCVWCRENKLPDTKQNQRAFTRTKRYIKEISLSSMAFLLKHIPLADLPYFVSTGKEFMHTGRNFSAWLGKWYEKNLHS